jgi:hypothetical protein
MILNIAAIQMHPFLKPPPYPLVTAIAQIHISQGKIDLNHITNDYVI